MLCVLYSQKKFAPFFRNLPNLSSVKEVHDFSFYFVRVHVKQFGMKRPVTTIRSLCNEIQQLSKLVAPSIRHMNKTCDLALASFNECTYNKHKTNNKLKKNTVVELHFYADGRRVLEKIFISIRGCVYLFVFVSILKRNYLKITFG